MKYKIGEKINFFDREAIIIATKKEPYVPKNDQSNRKEIFPEKGCDYIIMFKENEEKYKGMQSVKENDIENEE